MVWNREECLENQGLNIAAATTANLVFVAVTLDRQPRFDRRFYVSSVELPTLQFDKAQKNYRS
jgi:hypothetical protein